MTPGAFDDGERAIVLAPNVVAAVIDAAARTLLTTSAQRRPEVAQRLALGAAIASPVLTLVDDPTTPGAYGGFQFDDEGVPATPVTLLDRGKVAAPIARGRRPGHVGPLAPYPSHLRLAPGAVKDELTVDTGYLLEGAGTASVDPSSDRVVVTVARAHELVRGKRSGRVFADVELVGDLGPLLASVSDASVATETFGIRDERDGQPTWRSIEAPYLRGKGVVRARRRPV
jgi:TldD protein